MSPSPLDPLEIYLLGEVSFDDVQRLQRRLVYDLGETRGGALILCEHPPILSVGRSGSRAHIRADDDELREMGLSMRWVNRGGGCLLHLPGQLAAYLVMPLEPRELDLGRYLETLHTVLIDVLAEFDLHGRTWPEQPGVFLNHSRVGSVGVAVNRWIAYHGMTLNVGPFLGPFDVLHEPGLARWPLRQTSMEAQRQRAAPMAKVRESLIRHIEHGFGLVRHHLYTDHPLVRAKARSNVYVSSFG
ncbi:MAG: lipoate-protein ligase [Planctomycetota bacterium]|nr:lipoate-protein ligase [Planctomycetota bacterium]